MESTVDGLPDALPDRGPAILVVEDDELVRLAVARYLRDIGYTVLEAGHVDDAVAMLAANPSVKAVFSDVKLPGSRSGIDLANLVRTEYPGMKVLLTSGVSPLPQAKGVTLLRKPYFLFDLERHLKEMLATDTRST